MLVFGRVAVVVVGVLAGYSLLPVRALFAQPQKPSYDPKRGQAPVWETVVPAPPLSPGARTLWPNQPSQATYWSIQDIRKAHHVLADAESAGRTVEPNTALHDFPYWTRTHSMFIYHTPRKPAANSTQQHMGYAQVVVVMGGSGTLVAGGRIHNAHVLTESGQQIPGELRGSSIDDGKTYQLAVGDMLSIPPNTPAQFTSETPGGLTYMVMKVNAMLYPWDLIR
jgi:mannose-6-phosphate isomerase-like protein (cupin superfamily)